MNAHPFAELFPLMSAAEYAGLVRSIKAEGQLQAIVIYEGQILDGRNRWRACAELGVTPWLIDFSGADPLRYAIAVNTERRALSEAQRAMVAERLANVEHGFNRFTKVDGHMCPSTIDLEAAAELLHVSRRAAVNARKIRRECEPAVVAAVIEGEMSLNKALGTLPKQDAAKAMADNSVAIQKLAVDAHISWAEKGDAISKAIRDATGHKLMRKADLSDPATRDKVEQVIATFAGQPLDEQYTKHRAEVAAVSETAKEKLERLVARELQLRNAMLDQEIIAAARARLPDEAEALRAAKVRADAEFKKYAAARKGIPAQLSEPDYKFLLQVLHPDRAPEDRRDKFARAFDIVRKLDAYIEAFKA